MELHGVRWCVSEAQSCTRATPGGVLVSATGAQEETGAEDRTNSRLSSGRSGDIRRFFPEGWSPPSMPLCPAMASMDRSSGACELSFHVLCSVLHYNVGCCDKNWWTNREARHSHVFKPSHQQSHNLVSTRSQAESVVFKETEPTSGFLYYTVYSYEQLMRTSPQRSLGAEAASAPHTDWLSEDSRQLQLRADGERWAPKYYISLHLPTRSSSLAFFSDYMFKSEYGTETGIISAEPTDRILPKINSTAQ